MDIDHDARIVIHYRDPGNDNYWQQSGYWRGEDDRYITILKYDKKTMIMIPRENLISIEMPRPKAVKP